MCIRDRSNNQAGLNTQMQNFDDEENWEWPHLRGNRNASSNPHISGISMQGNVNNGITNQVNTQAMNANAPIAPYSESERAVIPNYEPINNDAQLREAQNDLKISNPDEFWRQYVASGHFGGFEDPLYQEWADYQNRPEAVQAAERARIAQQNEAARVAFINQDAMDRLRGTGIYASSSNASNQEANGYTAAQNLAAKQLRQRYGGLPIYSREDRIRLGVPEELLGHPFNMY